MIRSGIAASAIASRHIRDVCCVPRRGKKKKLDLLPLEGEEARYFNPTLLSGVNEPEYISLLKPLTPFYHLINIKVSLMFAVTECPFTGTRMFKRTKVFH